MPSAKCFHAIWLMLAALSTRARAQSWHLERVTELPGGILANGGSGGAALSADGRFVAFTTASTNLASGTATGHVDCVLLDRSTWTFENVSVDSLGNSANDLAWEVDVSNDGRYVAFMSAATNLDPRDTDSFLDVYWRDRLTGVTELVTVREGSAPTAKDINFYDLSGDGQYVAFNCTESNVLANNVFVGRQTYVRDMFSKSTEIVSLGPAGQIENGADFASISDDGRWCVFASFGTGWFPAEPGYLYGLFLRDRLLGRTIPVTLTPSGRMSKGQFLYPQISGDGNVVVFDTFGANIWQPNQVHIHMNIARWTRTSGSFENLSLTATGTAANNDSQFSVPSGDGRRVVFATYASNLVPQPFGFGYSILRDAELDTSVALGINAKGKLANSTVWSATISRDGRVTAFDTSATNLLPGNGGAIDHVYVRVTDTTSAMTFCKASAAAGGCGPRMDFTGEPSASAGSGFVVSTRGLPSNQACVLLFSAHGSWGAPLATGYLCVAPPFQRALATTSGGTPSGVCDGLLKLDVNAALHSGPLAGLGAGQLGALQAWSRDASGAPVLSDAVVFQVGP